MCAALVVPIVKSDYRLYGSVPRISRSRLTDSVGDSYSNPDLIRHEIVDLDVEPAASKKSHDKSAACVNKNGRRRSEADFAANNDMPDATCDLDDRQLHYYYRRRPGGVSVGGSVHRQYQCRPLVMPVSSCPSDKLREEKLRQILAEKARQRRLTTCSESGADSNQPSRQSTPEPNFTGKSLIKLLRHMGLAPKCKKSAKPAILEQGRDESALNKRQ